MGSKKMPRTEELQNQMFWRSEEREGWGGKGQDVEKMRGNEIIAALEEKFFLQKQQLGEMSS